MEINRKQGGIVGALWGILGIQILLIAAVYRLTPFAIDTFSYDLYWYHIIFLVISLFFMAFFEGYMGFQRRFSPRVASRARYLRDNPRTDLIILAPFFCMAYFHAPLKRKITSVSLTIFIILMIIAVRKLSQPWKGIVDVGVVIGLIWGIISIAIYSYQAFTHDIFDHPPEIE